MVLVSDDHHDLSHTVPTWEDFVPPVDTALVAADVRRSPFVQRCLALAAWVGEQGRRVTPNGVLELADARAAFHELHLASVAAGTPPPRGSDHQLSLLDPGQEIELALLQPLDGLRSAADLPVLHELWRACLDSGLVMIMDQRAYGATRPPEEHWDWQLLGTDLAVSRLVMQDDGRAASYVFALWPQVDHEWTCALGAGVREDGTVSRRALTKAWWRSWWNPEGRSSPHPARARSDHDFRVTVDVPADLGVWSRDGDRMTGTTWGSDLVDVLEEMVDMPDPFAGGTIEVELHVDRP